MLKNLRFTVKEWKRKKRGANRRDPIPKVDVYIDGHERWGNMPSLSWRPARAWRYTGIRRVKTPLYYSYAQYGSPIALRIAPIRQKNTAYADLGSVRRTYAIPVPKRTVHALVSSPTCHSFKQAKQTPTILGTRSIPKNKTYMCTSCLQVPPESYMNVLTSNGWCAWPT